MSRELKDIPLNQIIVHDVKIREVKKDTEDYANLRRMIATYGVQSPIHIRPFVNKETQKVVPNMWSLIDGLQRFSISQELEFKTVPALINRDAQTDEDEFAIQFVLNKGRVKSNPIEEREHIKKYMFRHPEVNRENIAATFGLNYNQLSKLLALDRLTSEASELVEKGEIKASAAYQLASIPKEYQITVKIGDEISSPIKLAMSMPVQDFIGYCEEIKKSVKKASKEGTKNLGPVINPQPLNKNALIDLWSIAQDGIESNLEGTEKYLYHKGRFDMIEQVLQIDSASLQRKKEQKAERKSANALEVSRKRKEEADKQYELAKNKIKEEEKLVESIS